MAKTETLTVDGQQYQVTALDTTPGLALYDELRIALAGIIESAMSEPQIAGETGGEQLIERIVMAGIGGIPRGMPEKLSKIFAPRTKVQMQSTNGPFWVALEGEIYESHFSARLKHWQSWILACLKFQFADFLPASASSTAPNADAAAPTK